MKKVLLIAIFTTSMFFTAKAQVEKGRVLLGAAVGFSIFSPEAEGSSTTSTFTFLPEVSYFLSDKVSIGIGIGFQAQRLDLNNLSDETITNSQFVIAPNVRYWKEIGDSGQWYFHVQFRPSYSFGRFKTQVGSISTETDSQEIEVAINPGFSFLPSEKWLIELGFRGLYYNSFDPNTNTDNDGNSEFGLDANSLLTPQISVRIFF
jgi:hypothetical protein